MNRYPTYSLQTVQEIALSKRNCIASKRVFNWFENHGYPSRMIQDIVLALKESDYYKTDELEWLPGKMADIYKTEYEAEIWYVKLFIDQESEHSIVRIWSCVPNAYPH